MRGYLDFLLTNRRFLAFGLTLTLFSSVGQTFFIALFSEDIRDAFDLTHGGFGALYSLATFASGFTLIFAGRLIDQIDLRVFTIAMCAGLTIACLLMGLAPFAAVLILAIFMLRFFGQGMMGHIALTSMARYFNEGRGKAMSIASMGYAVGEAIMPTLGVVLIAAFGLRGSWLALAAGLALVLVPLVLWLLRGHSFRHARYLAQLRRDAAEDQTSDDPRRATIGKQWTRGEVLRDPRFYMFLPAVLGPPFIVTGVFFHQVHLVNEKGWDLQWWAVCFVGFALTQFPIALIAGVLIDRFTARRLLPILLVPLGTGLATIALVDHPASALIFLILAGITAGIIGPLLGSMWAELYGVLHLGAIRALVTAMMVFATSLSPVILGVLIDGGVGMTAILLGCVAYVIVAIALVMVSGVPRRLLVTSRRIIAPATGHDSADLS